MDRSATDRPSSQQDYFHSSYTSPRSGRRRRRRRRRNLLPLILLIAALILLTAGVVFGARKLYWHFASKKAETEATSAAADIEEGDPEDAPDGQESPAAGEDAAGGETQAGEKTSAAQADSVLEEAERCFAWYDYDRAIELVQSDPETAASAAGQELIARCEEIRPTLVRQDPQQITHVFFHTLIMDPSKAFDGDYKQDDYNEVMTTKSEFEKIMQSMYERGYVLVRLHDIAFEVDDTENGGKKMVWGDIMLPPGKKAFVCSQDDVCYYEYMEGDGYASRLIIDERGKPVNEMVMDDGSISVGSYDVVPLLDDFVEAHPDFSYRGSKGIVAVTGYNGVFGYRTDDTYAETNPNFEADKQMVRDLAQCLRDDGWEISSHSWGHRNYGEISMENLREDNEKWQTRVGELIGGTDILIFPFGSDVGSWHPYSTDNERFMYLWRSGFRYFCNVDSNQYFVQKGNDFLRQGRRNLDGYRMWQDMTVKNLTSDLFNAEEVFDPARPTPVPTYE